MTVNPVRPRITTRSRVPKRSFAKRFSFWKRAIPMKVEFTRKYMMVAGAPIIGVEVRFRFIKIIRTDM